MSTPFEKTKKPKANKHVRHREKTDSSKPNKNIRKVGTFCKESRKPKNKHHLRYREKQSKGKKCGFLNPPFKKQRKIKTRFNDFYS